MVETMRREGHKALVHTAAASNLGQMLNKICLKDGIPLVNIVRSAEQAEDPARRSAPNTSSTPPRRASWTTSPTALAETGATIAFDAIGGGKLAGQILTAMEAAVNKTAKAYSRYGSTRAQAGLHLRRLDIAPDRAAPRLRHGLGRRRLAADSVPDEDRAGRRRQRCAQRVVDELKTTFASHYTKVISLQEALDPDNHRRLHQAGHRREIPDQPEQDLRDVPRHTFQRRTCLLSEAREHSRRN